jgi:RimJ/RimL family protein N-acetyltransferase
MEELDLKVREIQEGDVDGLLSYWFNSDADYLADMGADIRKLPSRDEFLKSLMLQINSPIELKESYALIWFNGNKRIGHSNVNQIQFGKEATMHLHLWQSENRRAGMGAELVKKSLPFYFESLKLKKLICEPYALNAAPNKTLERVGFSFVKRYTTVPGYLNFEQEVNRWELSKENYLKASL